MKTKRIELDSDFIGSQSSTLTKKEELALTEYFHANKAKMGRKSLEIKVKS